MIKAILRSAGAIVASLVVAMVLIVAVEVIGNVFYPFPADADVSDPEAMRAHVARCPQWLLAAGVIGWGIAVFASAWVATRLGAGRHPAHGIAIGALLLLAAGFNMFMLPYPVWFEIANLVTIPLATVAAVRLGRAKRAEPSG